MTEHPYTVVDVFADQPYHGNPLAVVSRAGGVSAAAMQRFASWTNLSETTFIVPPTDAAADYRLRIFTPQQELPFAGHPTLGSCHAWLAAGGVPRQADMIIQQCGAGLVRIRRSPDGRLAFAAPPLRRAGPLDAATRAQLLGELNLDDAQVRDAAWVDNGPGWAGLLLADTATVLALNPVRVSQPVGVIGAYPAGAPAAFEVRAFFPQHGFVLEDPVTGSLNASLAQWLIGAGYAHAPYVVAQGQVLGRAGRVHIAGDAAGDIWVGGATLTCVRGTVVL
ncbi:MAG: PhzF family phenazine biosynthesis protein [Chloroflexi bacterium]|nr:PhzF family phenazine biosynthesis protein [Chloroflexota bacterium]